MIQASTLGVWGGLPPDGNSQFFDNSFDYDTLTFDSTGLSNATPFTFLCTFRLSAGTITGASIPLLGTITSSGNNVIQFDLLPSGSTFRPRLSFLYSGSQLINYFTSSFPISKNTDYTVIYTNDGLKTTSSVRININGTGQSILTQQFGTVPTYNPANTIAIGGLSTGPSDLRLFAGNIRNFEILSTNYAGTQELTDAAAAGSFKGIVDNSNYLLDVNFTRRNGENPITNGGTPTYSITAIGGSVYQDF